MLRTPGGIAEHARGSVNQRMGLSNLHILQSITASLSNCPVARAEHVMHVISPGGLLAYTCGRRRSWYMLQILRSTSSNPNRSHCNIEDQVVGTTKVVCGCPPTIGSGVVLNQWECGDRGMYMVDQRVFPNVVWAHTQTLRPPQTVSKVH
jgi:hypothetical protein